VHNFIIIIFVCCLSFTFSARGFTACVYFIIIIIIIIIITMYEIYILN